MSSLDLFLFNNPEAVIGFRSVLDQVTGGRSVAHMQRMPEGNARFSGLLSLENGGGFASVRSFPRDLHIRNETHLALRVRGDGKRYQVHLRTNDTLDGISYRASILGPRNWGTVVIPFSGFAPTYRGKILKRAPPMQRDRICTVGFMVADRQEGPFTLDLAWVRALRLVN